MPPVGGAGGVAFAFALAAASAFALASAAAAAAWAASFAWSVLRSAIFPMIVVFFVAQRYFIGGIVLMGVNR